MTCDPEKFPGGHKWIVDTIRLHGFVPAIWTNANITNEDFPKHHPEDVLMKDGEPMRGEWIKFLYSCTEKNLEEQVTPVFEGFRDAGYKYVKIDAIRHLLFDGLHEAVRLGLMSNEEAEKKFRAYMEASSVGLDQINLDPEAEYHAFDFWKQEYLGIVSGEIKCPALDLGCCQIIGLRRVQKTPQFLASSRHVSMDAVSVENLKWDAGVLTAELTGAQWMNSIYYFAVPGGYEFCTAEVSGGTCSCRIDKKILAVDVLFEGDQAVLKLKF